MLIQIVQLAHAYQGKLFDWYDSSKNAKSALFNKLIESKIRLC